ncbi:hypothetical protein QPK87_21470 [Kamptonema cortianum]|nr:hypothetical protein [Desertifilum sp.]MDI9640731.1 hypothetical protein [Geitlerinema splendidum]MDK3159124.1 hypothetical protein [Kamptonema cortianum]MDL5050022.1 hypothetical protein [Oscillatoria amoena NRMC-F 0135]
MMIINLDDEAEKYLLEILSQEKMTSQELVKKLLRNHFMSLNKTQTILERMGGYPEELLEGDPNLSDRDMRHQQTSNYLQQRNNNRQS